MQIKRGTAVSPGVAIGPAFEVASEDTQIARKFLMPEEVEAEIARFETALNRAHREIEDLTEKLLGKLDDSYNIPDIFQVHLSILKDEKLGQQVVNMIRNRLFTAEYAVNQALRRYVKLLESSGDTYLLQRVRDFDDIEQRIMRNLRGKDHEHLAGLRGRVVVVAHDLTPSQTVSFDREKVLGIVTDAGGRTSHTAILARALKLPAVVGTGDLLSSVSTGDTIIVDGTQGVVIIKPDPFTLRRYEARGRSIEIIEEKIAAEFCNLPAITQDGRRVGIEANIEFPQEVAGVLTQGGEGVGLYRTEFLYHKAENPPDEETHFQAYMEAIRLLGSHPMTIRVLDLGADKFPSHRSEANPFLGYRSMRLMKTHADIFRNQIRAILRASAMGKIRFMFPLISNLAELRETKQLVRDVRTELDRAGTPYDKNIQVGMMIEVPSAAIMADTFAKESDFFSIGTNDLIQYALAVDRNNEHVSHLYSPVDPAILRLIKLTLDAGERAGIEVSMCGEMAGDILCTILLVGMGVKKFSMAPTSIADTKKLICNITYDQARKIAERAMSMDTAAEIESYLAAETRKIIPELFEQAEPM